MNQLNLILLTDFEQATVEQLVSYKIAKNDKNETDESINLRIEAMCNQPNLSVRLLLNV